MAGMKVRLSAGSGLVLIGLPSVFLVGCGGPNLPRLPFLPPPDTVSAAETAGPQESAIVVSGTPTGVFAQVARGVLGCWFAPNSPLKASHLYRAEAEPPVKGGAAEIVIHERDVALRDQRGSRAYRITFAGEASGVRVATTAIKFPLAQAQTMARDVESWAKGGDSCELRALFPPPPPAKTAKTATTAKGPSPGKKR